MALSRRDAHFASVLKKLQFVIESPCSPFPLNLLQRPTQTGWDSGEGPSGQLTGMLRDSPQQQEQTPLDASDQLDLRRGRKNGRFSSPGACRWSAVSPTTRARVSACLSALSDQLLVSPDPPARAAVRLWVCAQWGPAYLLPHLWTPHYLGRIPPFFPTTAGLPQQPAQRLCLGGLASGGPQKTNTRPRRALRDTPA